MSELMPEEAIEFYAKYVVDQADRAYDRNGYRYLMAYLRKIQRCTGGAETAMSIAKTWRSEYKRKWAMMEELTNAGF
ncbi:MAG: hypothetical protein Q4B26_14710 [Eubacteriales bacterium]|nr:hypothetical protein [Eubacteriales bacterium]